MLSLNSIAANPVATGETTENGAGSIGNIEKAAPFRDGFVSNQPPNTSFQDLLQNLELVEPTSNEEAIKVSPVQQSVGVDTSLSSVVALQTSVPIQSLADPEIEETAALVETVTPGQSNVAFDGRHDLVSDTPDSNRSFGEFQADVPSKPVRFPVIDSLPNEVGQANEVRPLPPQTSLEIPTSEVVEPVVENNSKARQPGGLPVTELLDDDIPTQQLEPANVGSTSEISTISDSINVLPPTLGRPQLPAPSADQVEVVGTKPGFAQTPVSFSSPERSQFFNINQVPAQSQNVRAVGDVPVAAESVIDSMPASDRPALQTLASRLPAPPNNLTETNQQNTQPLQPQVFATTQQSTELAPAASEPLGISTGPNSNSESVLPTDPVNQGSAIEQAVAIPSERGNAVSSLENAIEDGSRVASNLPSSSSNTNTQLDSEVVSNGQITLGDGSVESESFDNQSFNERSQSNQGTAIPQTADLDVNSPGSAFEFQSVQTVGSPDSSTLPLSEAADPGEVKSQLTSIASLALSGNEIQPHEILKRSSASAVHYDPVSVTKQITQSIGEFGQSESFQALNSGANKVVQIHLDPPSLGELVVQVSHEDSVMKVQIVAERWAAHSLIEEHVEMLVDSIQDNNDRAVQVDVSHRESKQQQSERKNETQTPNSGKDKNTETKNVEQTSSETDSQMPSSTVNMIV